MKVIERIFRLERKEITGSWGGDEYKTSGVILLLDKYFIKTKSRKMRWGFG